jgi:hypothetical protein
MGVFNAVERQEEAVLALLFRSHQVFDTEELPLADDPQDPLVRIRLRQSGKLVAGVECYADACGFAELNDFFQPVVASFAGYADMIEPACPGANRLLYRVKAVKNFHLASLPPYSGDERALSGRIGVGGQLVRDGSLVWIPYVFEFWADLKIIRDFSLRRHVSSTCER